jgi:hypothetical protein
MKTTRRYIGRTALLIALTLTVVCLMQTASVQAKNPVTRPFQETGQVTIMDLLNGAPYAAIANGVSSQTGRFFTVLKYVDGVNGFGIHYAANGDQLFLKSAANTTEITGGTGRFEGATGLITITISAVDFASGPENTLSVIYTYTAEGTITY